MNVHAFLHRHYSSEVGESWAGHAIAIVTGGTMMVAGTGLAMSIVFLPVGAVIGLLGLFLLIEGVVGHITRPLKLRDLLDTVIGFAGAAIAATFALAIVFFLVSFGAGTVAGFIDWVRGAL